MKEEFINMNRKFFAAVLTVMIMLLLSGNASASQYFPYLRHNVLSNTPYQVECFETYPNYEFGTTTSKDTLFLKVDEGGNFQISFAVEGSQTNLVWEIVYADISKEEYEARTPEADPEQDYYSNVWDITAADHDKLSSVTYTSSTGTTNTVSGTLSSNSVMCKIWVKAYSEYHHEGTEPGKLYEYSGMEILVNNSQYFNDVFTYPETGSGSSVTPSPSPVPAAPVVLPSSTIEPVILSDDVLENLASIMSSRDVSSKDIHFITQDNLSSPAEPSDAMKNYMRNDGYNAAYKFNTVTVSDDGCYVFLVNIPDEFIGVKVSEVKLYAINDSEISASFYSLINGVLNYGEITNLLGVKIDTLEKQVLAVGILQAGTPFSVYLAKILLALLAGGCDMGLGLAGFAVITSTLFIFRKH